MRSTPDRWRVSRGDRPRADAAEGRCRLMARRRVDRPFSMSRRTSHIIGR
jgi:hypothetical protein